MHQEYATLRDLIELGVAAPALAAIPTRQKRAAIRAASAELAAYLRPRHTLPLVFEVEDLETTLAAGGAAALSGTPTAARDVAVRIAAGGTVGTPGVTYELSVDAGATYAAPKALPLSGEVTVDGATLTLSGPIATGNLVTWSHGLDYALRLHATGIASWILLHNRGLDPAVEQDLARRRDAAIAWGKDVESGTAQLEAAADATPNVSEGGPLGAGQTSPYDFLDAP